MNRRVRKILGISGGFFASFLLIFLLCTLGLFPDRGIRRWITTLDVPGHVTVASVGLDPFLRLTVRDLVWAPEANPFLRSVGLKRVLLRPAWGKVLTGHRVLIFKGETGGGGLSGTSEWRDSKLKIAVNTPASLTFSGLFRFHKGVALRGTGTMKMDLTVQASGSRTNIAGDFFLLLRHLRLQWTSSPLGPLTLTFISGTMEGVMDRSVMEVRKIDFRGNDLTVFGKATFWLDPLSGKLRSRGTLFVQPRLNLSESNPRLNAALRFLPRGRQGYKLTF